MEKVLAKDAVPYSSPLKTAYESSIREYAQKYIEAEARRSPIPQLLERKIGIDIFTYELDKEYHPTGNLSIKGKQVGDKWYIYVAVETKEGVDIDLRSLGNRIRGFFSKGEYESVRVVDNQEIKEKYTASVISNFDDYYSFSTSGAMGGLYDLIDWADKNIRNTVLRYLGHVVHATKLKENAGLYQKGWRQYVYLRHVWGIKFSDEEENFRLRYGASKLWYRWSHSTQKQKSAYDRLEKAYKDVYFIHKNNYDDLRIYALMHRNINNLTSLDNITSLPSVLYFAQKKHEIPGYCDRILDTDSARKEVIKLSLIYGPRFLCLSNSVLNLQKRVSVKKEFGLDDLLNYESHSDDSCDSYLNLIDFTEDDCRTILDKKESIVEEIYNSYKLQINFDARPDNGKKFIKDISYEGIVNQRPFVRSRINKWFKAYGYNSFLDDLNNLREKRIDCLRKIEGKLNKIALTIKFDHKQLGINNGATDIQALKTRIDRLINYLQTGAERRCEAKRFEEFERNYSFHGFRRPSRIEELRKWIYDYENIPADRWDMSPTGYVRNIGGILVSSTGRFTSTDLFTSTFPMTQEAFLREVDEKRKKIAEVEKAYPLLKKELAELEKSEQEQQEIEKNQEREQRKREEGFILELESIRAEVDKITDLVLGMKIFEILADNLSSVNRYVSDAYDRLHFLLKVRELQQMDATIYQAEYIKSLIKRDGHVGYSWPGLRSRLMSYWCTALQNVEDKKQQEEIRLQKLRDEQMRREAEIRMAKLRYNQNNVHPRDSRLSFRPDSHQYIVDGLILQSVTDFVENCFPKFNAIEHAQKVAARSGKSTNEILKQWEEKGKESRELGTVLHKQIENYYQGNNCVIDDAFSLFKIFADKFQLCAYRSEWAVYDTDYNIAGTIDFIDYQNGEFIIYDWKRSDKVIENGMPVKTNKYGEKGLHPIEHLDNCAYYHYALQLSMYKFILERNYGMTIKDLRLGIFHPSYNKPYILKMPYLEQEIKTLMELRSDILF